MKVSIYYYASPSEHGYWEIHQKGCPKLSEGNFKIFLGSLYTSGQAITVARVRTGEQNVRECPYCLGRNGASRRYIGVIKPVTHTQRKK